jgi:hypothetical protein
MASSLFDIHLDLDKETKGAVRYAERGASDTHKIGTIYIRKTALKEPYPKAIKLTVAVALALDKGTA